MMATMRGRRNKQRDSPLLSCSTHIFFLRTSNPQRHSLSRFFLVKTFPSSTVYYITYSLSFSLVWGGRSSFICCREVYKIHFTLPLYTTRVGFFPCLRRKLHIIFPCFCNSPFLLTFLTFLLHSTIHFIFLFFLCSHFDCTGESEREIRPSHFRCVGAAKVELVFVPTCLSKVCTYCCCYMLLLLSALVQLFCVCRGFFSFVFTHFLSIILFI